MRSSSPTLAPQPSGKPRPSGLQRCKRRLRNTRPAVVPSPQNDAVANLATWYCVVSRPSPHGDPPMKKTLLAAALMSTALLASPAHANIILFGPGDVLGSFVDVGASGFGD